MWEKIKKTIKRSDKYDKIYVNIVKKAKMEIFRVLGF